VKHTKSLPNISQRRQKTGLKWIFDHAQLMILDGAFKKMIRKLKRGKKFGQGHRQQKTIVRHRADFSEILRVQESNH
jgi:hypothetical protein